MPSCCLAKSCPTDSTPWYSLAVYLSLSSSKFFCRDTKCSRVFSSTSRCSTWKTVFKQTPWQTQSMQSSGSSHAFKLFEHILQTDSKLHFLHEEKDKNKNAATASPRHLILIFRDAVDQPYYSLFPMCPSQEPNVLNGFWLARAPPRKQAPPGRTAWGPDHSAKKK